MAQLPIAEFLTERLAEYDPEFELRKGTGFESLFFKPMQFIVQPLRDEANDLFIAQSFRRILLTDDPDAFDEDSVDALASNLFVERRLGGQSSGVARVYYNDPVDREYPANGAVFVGSNSETYTNPAPFKITQSQMSTQIEDGLYYFDIPVQSVNTGDVDLEEDELVSLEGDTEVVRVTNQNPISGGVERETNREFIERVRKSIGVRDLVTGKGFNAILFENFASVLQEIQPIGFGDVEMMRDVIYNAHIGGRVDGYFKTPTIRQGSADFVGLLVDTTRQTFTSANVQLNGTDYESLGNPNVDRSNDKNPIVQEIKESSFATFITTVDLALPIDLSITQHVKIGFNGTFKNIRIAGVNPAATTRNEIVNLINNAFGQNIAFPEGNYIRFRTPNSGLDAEIVVDNPDVGNSAILAAFGLSTGTAPHVFSGDGPVTFLEGIHYEIDDGTGRIRRVVGPSVVLPQTTGDTVDESDIFADATANIFLNVQEQDILTITSGADAGDYRILEKISNNSLRLDAELTATASGINYHITRTGIKDEEFVYVQYWFNPLSIDIGSLVKLDEDGRVRGIRPGREAQTITDLAFLRIRSIELIDALTREPLGTVLDGVGGYGQGGYGKGQYGIGSGSDYRLVVVSPEERFSMFEDSYIVIRSGFSGLSFRVNYDYVPEVEDLHNFVRSESERVLDGDILMKHFLPVYVQGVIQYRVDSTDSTILSNEDLQAEIIDYINKSKSGQDLEYSDLYQFIIRKVDPFDRYSSFVRPFKLTAVIHNTDGTITKITGDEKLTVPTLDPFPKYTTRPLSPRITHWIADDLVLERIP